MFFFVKKNTSRNRDKLDLIGDVLSAASVKVRKTKIMYRANLSYSQLEKYLRIAVENGLVERDANSFYLITDKGRTFQGLYSTYLERCKRMTEEADVTSKTKLLLESMCFNNKS